MTAAFGKFSEKEEGVAAPRGGQATSIVGRGAELEGDLTGTGQLRVEGRVDGTIRMDGEVQVAGGGDVDGRIEADRVVVAGRVEGTIAAREAVRLEDGCHVDADIYSPALELMEGGVLDGRVDMSGSGLPEEPEVPAEGRGTPAGSGPMGPEAAPVQQPPEVGDPGEETVSARGDEADEEDEEEF